VNKVRFVFRSVVMALLVLMVAACQPAAPTIAPTEVPATVPAVSTIAPTEVPPTAQPEPTPVIQDLDACRLPSQTADRGVALGFPAISIRMGSTGTLRAAVLFVDFSDMPGSKSPEQLLALLDGATDYFTAMSNGRMDLQLVPHMTLIRMTRTTAGLGLSDNSITYDEHRAYLQEAIDLASPDFDFSDIDAVYVISDPDASPTSYGPAFTGDPGYALTADGKEILNGVTSGQDLPYWGFKWLNHEVLHTMGLVDLYAYAGDTHRFVGNFGLMGDIEGKGPELFSYERWQLGWLGDEQIVCQTAADQTTVITPIETAGGIKAVIVPTGPTTAVVIESRRAEGYDSGLPKGGALVYTIDTSVYSGEGVLQIQNGSGNYLNAPLAAGQSVTVGNVTVTVVSSDASGDTVQVTVAP